jgi:PKD repeat protein
MSDRIRRIQPVGGFRPVNSSDVAAAANRLRRTQSTIQTRMSDLQSAAADVTVVSCKIPVNNTGETEVTFMFPVKFSDIPSVVFGFQNQTTPIAGQAPLFSASVLHWHTEDRLPFSRLYTGATFLIVSEATPGYSYVCNATITGVAFSGPTTEDMTNADPISYPPTPEEGDLIMGFSASSLSGTSPAEISFTDDSESDGTIVSRIWDFGDGYATSGDSSPSHTYGSAGTYPATLTITDSLGNTDSISENVVISGPADSPGASSFHLWWHNMNNTYDEVSVKIRVTDPPVGDPLYFWALQVEFTDSDDDEILSGAHVGLQSWNGSDYPNGRAVNWGGYISDAGQAQFGPGLPSELVGSTSDLPSAEGNVNTRNYNWSSAKTYRLHIFKVANEPGQPAGTTRWRAQINDLTLATATTIRDIYAYGDRITGISMWSEIFAACSAESVSVKWSEPWAEIYGTSTKEYPDEFYVTYQSHASGGCHNTNSYYDGTGFVQKTLTTRITPHDSFITI